MLDLRMHELRHTAAALMIAEEAHLGHMKRHLGHSSIVVTMDRYGHLFPAGAEAVADRLDDAFRRSLTDIGRTSQQPQRVVRIQEVVEGTHIQGLPKWAR